MNQRFGRYQILHKLGQGAMSAVFLARDPILARLVAVKVLHQDLLYQPSVLERFFKEAKTVSRISSPHVVNVFDFGMEGQTPYLVMEYVNGQTLQKVLDQLGGDQMDPVVATALIAQVVEGISVAADMGVVHRDLKPENLMLTQKGNLKVMDFGICHLKEHTITRTGQILGSPRFMSPEQVRGLKPLSPQSDLFSLGAVFYYLLAGVPPFMAESMPDLYRQIVSESYPNLLEIRPGMDRGLVRLIDTLLEKDPAKRGQGHSWVSLQVRKYLMRKKVLAPTERISEYVRELSEAGVRTTSDLDPEQVRQWMGSLNLGKRPSRATWRRKIIWVASSILLLAAIGLAVGFHTASKQKQKPAPSIQVQEPPLEPVTAFMESSTHTEEKLILPDPVHFHSKSRIAKVQDAVGETSLTIQCVPPFAEVFFDGYSLGQTPMEGKSCPSGKHRLTLKTRFGVTMDTVVRLEPGPKSFKFMLMENPELKDSL